MYSNLFLIKSAYYRCLGFTMKLCGKYSYQKGLLLATPNHDPSNNNTRKSAY